MNTSKNVYFPAIRARLGDWWYYVATLSFRDIEQRVSKVSEIHESKELKTWIQRDLVPGRLEEISSYIKTQPQHFFNALVLGIYGGDPDWFPVKVSESAAVPDAELDERITTAFGLIKLTGKEEIFAIDGQHRVEGIKKALESDETGKLEKEEQAVIFVSHKNSVQGHERTRRLFSTLNKYAKPVSKGEIIALSEDDTFAKVTRKLVDVYPGLQSDFVPLLKTPNIPANDKKSIISVISLYDVVRTLALPPRSREKKALEVGPPLPAKINELYDLSVSFWDALKKHFPEIRKVCASKPSENLVGEFRRDDGGHLLFRPAGMGVFAKAVRVMMNRGSDVEKAVATLKKSNMELAEDPWRFVLWDPNRKTMILTNGLLAKNLLLKEAKQRSDPEDYDVKEQYQRAIGEAKTAYEKELK